LKPIWTRILFAVLISSCAANRIEHVRTPDQLSDIKSGHFKGSELACTSIRTQHPGHNDKAFRSGQPVLHRPAGLSLQRSRKGKSNTSSANQSHADVESILVKRERISEAIGLDLPELLFPIKNTINGPHCSIVSLNQKDKENSISEKYPVKYRIQIPTQINPNQPKLQTYHKREGLVYLTVLLVGLLSLAGLKITPDLAGNISYWAALNPRKSRFIISVIQIMTGMAGLILGTKLANMGTHFSDLSKSIVAATFFTSVLLYPVRKSRIRLIKRTYFRQKTHDLVLFLSGLMLMVFAGNYYSLQINSLANLAGKQDYIEVQEYVPLEKDQPHDPMVILQQANQVQDKPATPPKDGWIVGLKVFFTIVASVAIGFGVAALSCELSCSGLNGLAVIVAILGAAGIAFLLYFSMKAIFNPKHKRTKSLSPA
jgi:hypothetical protein